jgi:hypothetical protein
MTPMVFGRGKAVEIASFDKVNKKMPVLTYSDIYII